MAKIIEQPTSNPDFGREIRIERHGNEAHLIFVAATRRKADRLIANLLKQLKAGGINMALGEPISVTEDAQPAQTAKAVRS